MMTNLFSVFDPCTGIFSMNWISIMMFMFLFPKKYWFLQNKNMIMFNILITKLNSELVLLMKYKGMSMIMLSMFIMILLNNIMGLLPYIFTASSHLVFSISLALPMWMGFMIYGWLNNTNHMFMHLVPVGTPPILMPFMVLIETISNLIRPGSLAVRLTANMIAGHLLMSLLGNNMSNYVLMISCMIFFIILMMFETAVALIQAYVFMTLTNLYSSEV
uniref:ATP synthase F0 subunit 6 n=1 Tax=Atkinsoniella uniguttata TaxID=2930060 RepID=UPI0020018D86|nr:ATP synthase F0 subunit 6 [Atkinsoniella uniguttata]UNZ12630.1 ATP synthase F0 subunit 6 [Atkinsoniella uniguttata]